MRKPKLLITAFCLLFFSSRALAQENEKVPYVPSPIEVVDRMLEFADVNKTDVVFDIGSGDGRMVIQAAKKYGAKGVGPGTGWTIGGDGPGRGQKARR